MNHPVAVRSSFGILFAALAYLALAQSGEGTLRVEIRDKASGQIVPAMVCITSLADHKWRTPPDGRIVPGYTSTREFYTPGDWKPGGIGPVRLTNGDYGDNDVRSVVYDGESAYPFWREPAAYFVAQPFSITLPAGKWRLAVARGIEFLPAFEDFEIAPSQSLKRNIALERWVDMPKQGWYSGDDHVHFPRQTREHDEFLMTWAQAEDVHVANILRMGDIEQTYFEPRGYGRDFRYQQGDYVLATGQEDPRTGIDEQGHTIALNITAPVRDTSRYHLYDFMFDGVHQQGGLAGYAHVAWAPKFYRRERSNLYPTWDSTIDVVRGKVDFFEILQFRRLGLDDYYDFLNLGFKVTALAGSDLPWGSTMGEARVYAYTGAPFSADAWFSAVKQGRTFVTNGPMLTLTAGTAMPGDESQVARNTNIHIRARAWAPELIGSPKSLEIISSGRVIRSAESSDPRKTSLEAELDIRADQNLWVAARVQSHNGALAHTSPIYLRVNGQNSRSEAASQAAAAHIKVLDFIQGRLTDQRFTAEYSPGEVAALQQRIAEARSVYAGILAERPAP